MRLRHGLRIRLPRRPRTAARRRALRMLTVPLVLAAAGLGLAQVASSAPRPDPHLAAPVHARVPGAHVVPQATGLTGRAGARVPNKKGPARVAEPWNVDGCDHDYGTPDMCVPWAIPGKTTAARCGWLQANGFQPFRVYGTDRQKLDPAHTALACSVADLKAGTA